MDKFSKHFSPLIWIIFQCLTGHLRQNVRFPFCIHLLGLVFPGICWPEWKCRIKPDWAFLKTHLNGPFTLTQQNSHRLWRPLRLFRLDSKVRVWPLSVRRKTFTKRRYSSLRKIRTDLQCGRGYPLPQVLIGPWSQMDFPAPLAPFPPAQERRWGVHSHRPALIPQCGTGCSQT